MDFDKKEICSYLDGVPMRIGAKFLPPRNVSLPLAFNPYFPLDLLEEEYDFSLEKDVLESVAKEKVLAEENVTKAREEKVSSDIENFANGTSRSSLEDQPTKLNTNVRSTNPPTSTWQSASILQPQLHYKTRENGPLQSKDSSKSINLSDFENDTSSPFDYMELQTINDFEELSTVFQGLNENKCVTSTSKLSDKDSSKNKNIFSSVNSSVPSSSVCLESDRAVGNFSKSSSSSLAQNSIVNSDKTHCSSENNIYCDLYNKRILASSCELNGGNQLSYSYPGVAKPVDYYSSAERSQNQEPTVTYGKNGGSYTVQYRAPKPAKILTYEHILNDQSNLAESRSYGVLRGSKSVSDLCSLPLNKSIIPSSSSRSHTPPPIMMVSKQACVNSHVEETLAKKLMQENQDNGSCTSFPDPYDELQSTEKLFVDSITDMGFLRSQVARTVKHIGVDEKKVVEHLCQIQMLEESGYDSLEAEAALHLHNYNRDEAKKYLDHLNQIQGLGFEKTAIKKALVQNKNDMDKAINALLL